MLSVPRRRRRQGGVFESLSICLLQVLRGVEGLQVGDFYFKKKGFEVVRVGKRGIGSGNVFIETGEGMGWLSKSWSYE